MVIAVDFDDTLHDRSHILPGYRMGQPTPSAVESIKRLVNAGHQIIIFTARNVQEPSMYKAVEDWLNHFNVPFHGITNIKRPEFDLYIDNRNIHYKSWPLVLAEIDRLQNKNYYYDFINEEYKEI